MPVHLRVAAHAVQRPVEVPAPPQGYKRLAALARPAGPLTAPGATLDLTVAGPPALRALVPAAPEAPHNVLLYTGLDQEITPLGPGSGLLLGGYSAGAISLSDTRILPFCVVIVYIL